MYLQLNVMGNHLQKKLSKEEFHFLEYNTDFGKLHILDYYKEFMVKHLFQLQAILRVEIFTVILS